MAVQQKLMTAEEFAKLPDDGKRYDLVRGVPVEVGRPKPIHGKIQRRMGARIGDFVDQNELGEVTTESGFILGRDPDVIRGPDVAYLSKARSPNPDLTAYIPMGPDLAVEIVSPGDTAQEVLDKVEEYFKAGTRLVWVVYPEKRKVYAYQSSESVQIVGIEGTLEGGDVLPGFVLSMRDIFKGLEG